MPGDLSLGLGSFVPWDSVGAEWQCALATLAAFRLLWAGHPFLLLLLLGSERVSQDWRLPSTILESDLLCEERINLQLSMPVR